MLGKILGLLACRTIWFECESLMACWLYQCIFLHINYVLFKCTINLAFVWFLVHTSFVYLYKNTFMIVRICKDKYWLFWNVILVKNIFTFITQLSKWSDCWAVNGAIVLKYWMNFENSFCKLKAQHICSLQKAAGCQHIQRGPCLIHRLFPLLQRITKWAENRVETPEYWWATSITT